MKNEKKKSKKKILKILLGIGAAGLALYAANKYIPGFNKNITKPAKDFAKSVASDVKESLLEENEGNKRYQEQKRNDSSLKEERPPRKFKRENVEILSRRTNNPRKDDRVFRHNNNKRNF